MANLIKSIKNLETVEKQLTKSLAFLRLLREFRLLNFVHHIVDNYGATL